MTDPSFNINKFDSRDTTPNSKGIGRSKGEKDFRKIYSKNEDGDKEDPEGKKQVKSSRVQGKENYEDVELELEAYHAKPQKTGSISLFQLAAAAEIDPESPLPVVDEIEEEFPVQEISPKVKEESLSALFNGYGTKEKLRHIQNEAKNMPPQEPDISYSKRLLVAENAPMAQEIPPAPLPMPKEKPKFNTHFAREQPDLASINPMALNPAPPAGETAPVQAPQVPRMTSQELQEIIDQIVSKIYTVKLDGQTDTVITLKHPPLFAEATVVLKAFENAKGEFNIAFENLNPAAKKVLEMQENQNSLRFALEQRGYAVHIITATTLTETVRIVDAESPEKGKDEDREGSQGKREQQEQE